MKKILPIITLLAAFFLCGCSSDDGPGEQEFKNFDLYGVGKWENPEDFTLLRYYTKVDTITLKAPSVSLVVKATEDTEVLVDWKIDGGYYESLHIDETHPSNQGITLSTYYPYLPDTFEYAGGMEITATAKVGKNTVKREAVIDEEERVRDVLYVDFGMTVEEVERQVELLKGEGKFTIREDGTGVENVAPHFIFSSPGKTLYIFDDEELLAEVAEFPSSIYVNETREKGNKINEKFIEFLRRLEIPFGIEFNSDGTLAGEYEWEREGIIYTVMMRDDVFPVEDSFENSAEVEYLPNSIGISYRPAGQ